ncbi:MAG TPA: diaminopimelate epimerase [Acidobacteriota bacterium]|nr:diaminopimelate epimerase [Acidobacteriota bacterium]
MPDRIVFAKAESLRNDFIVVRDSRSPRRWTPSRVAAICDRRRGVGADGLVILGPRRAGRIPFILCNGDGSRAEWSGNGIRCAAAFLGQTRPGPAHLILATGAGPIDVDLRSRSTGRVDVSFARPWPVVRDKLGHRLSHPPAISRVWSVDAGNPHWVFQVRDFRFDWEAFGRECQPRASATRGVNVGFVRIPNRRTIEMRLYERGVGPTPSSGSGALAAVAACREYDLIDDRVQVTAPGGTQAARCDMDNRTIRLAAAARVVFEGYWTLQ